MTLAANAADSDGTVAKVEFYQGVTLIGTATMAPYSIAWNNIPVGRYNVTAVATDNLGAATTSAAVTLVVDAPPTVALTSPVAGTVVTAPGTVAVSATAADSDGSIAKVEFYQGSTLIGTATAAPYSVTWANVPAGTYSLTAKATDDNGISTTSAPVAFIVNAPPTVAITLPAAGQKYSAPASIALAVNAGDADGRVVSVAYFQNGHPVATVTAAPFGTTWSNVPAGSYTLTAVATDDLGAATTSAAVTVTVNAAGAAKGIYYIHPDHLGTPRLITDQQQNIVWRWDNTEPFGNNPPDENPSNSGTRFPFDLRYPGQRADKETGLFYNYFRDGYDTTRGGYTQFDPIGLRGGINGYTYVGSNPLSRKDPKGLEWLPENFPTDEGAPALVPIWPYNNWYGNWCGPGGAGPTTSGVDCACKKHDQCYEDCRLDAKTRWLTRSGFFSACALRCDAELASHPSRNDCDSCSKP
ncbi:MAG: RHS domain-containing protein [Mycobacteriaceae bacterium]|nr:RHS domain-containing protein [Mycobacteriaceae bacterium]